MIAGKSLFSQTNGWDETAQKGHLAEQMMANAFGSVGLLFWQFGCLYPFGCKRPYGAFAALPPFAGARNLR